MSEFSSGPASSASLTAPASPAVTPSSWTHLRRHTAARIALGRTGGSLPTSELLAFALDHALARDAVHAPFDPDALAAELRVLPDAPEICVLASAAPDRATYLRRPDLGRRLSEKSAAQLATLGQRSPHSPPANDQRASPLPAPVHRPKPAATYHLCLIVSDGLSPLAARRQAPALLRELLPLLREANFTLAPLCVVRHARVGLIDEIGATLDADFALILLGERPGLGTPDSLSAYFTFAPAPGRTDADRNCVSNIRPAGLPPPAAALKLTAWLTAARTQRRSGIALKEPVTSSSLAFASGWSVVQ